MFSNDVNAKKFGTHVSKTIKNWMEDTKMIEIKLNPGKSHNQLRTYK
jgi:hypothetical protein